MKRYLIIIEKSNTGYSAYAPDLPGCIATGKTREEVEENLYNGILFHIESLIAEGLSLPEAKSESAIMVFA